MIELKSLIQSLWKSALHHGIEDLLVIVFSDLGLDYTKDAPDKSAIKFSRIGGRQILRNLSRSEEASIKQGPYGVLRPIG